MDFTSPIIYLGPLDIGILCAFNSLARKSSVEVSHLRHRCIRARQTTVRDMASYSKIVRLPAMQIQV